MAPYSQVELRGNEDEANSFSATYRNKLAAAIRHHSFILRRTARAILEFHYGLREDEADAMEAALQEPVVKAERLKQLKALLDGTTSKFGIVIEAHILPELLKSYQVGDVDSNSHTSREDASKQLKAMARFARELLQLLREGMSRAIADVLRPFSFDLKVICLK